MEETNWKTWALRSLRELNEIASRTGADYLPVACPACGRLRLEVDRVEEGDETGDPTCEKCGWRPSREVE